MPSTVFVTKKISLTVRATNSIIETFLEVLGQKVGVVWVIGHPFEYEITLVTWYGSAKFNCCLYSIVIFYGSEFYHFSFTLNFCDIVNANVECVIGGDVVCFATP